MSDLPSDIFDSKLEKKFLKSYKRIFSITELSTDLALKFVFGALILSYYATFSNWMGRGFATVRRDVESTVNCWPYFQNCGDWVFLQSLPDGHSQTFLYMVLFGLMALIIYLIYRKDWVLAHIAMLPLFFWHAFSVLFFSSGGNYDYYLLILSFVILFIPHKLFFIKLNLVLFYFLSTTVKIHEGWVLGTYFSALHNGLPLFPDWSIPVWTNLVILMEMVGAWLLFSKNRLLQRTVLFFFIMFHLYSGILVQYHYPTIVLPSIIIVFGLFYRFTPVPLDKRSVAGWMLVVLLCIFQSLSFIIPGDTKLTLEGNNYGLFMFEANHQCVSRVTIIYKGGMSEKYDRESHNARNRCDPWWTLQKIKKSCEIVPDIAAISWQFDHSINGGPFLRIVDEVNACKLEYKPFSHNDWIKTETEAEVIGFPVENVYY